VVQIATSMTRSAPPAGGQRPGSRRTPRSRVAARCGHKQTLRTRDLCRCAARARSRAGGVRFVRCVCLPDRRGRHRSWGDGCPRPGKVREGKRNHPARRVQRVLCVCALAYAIPAGSTGRMRLRILVRAGRSLGSDRTAEWGGNGGLGRLRAPSMEAGSSPFTAERVTAASHHRRSLAATAACVFTAARRHPRPGPPAPAPPTSNPGTTR